MLNICVVGTGYVGLVTGACLAELGHCVVCVDTDAQKVRGLQAGVIPIYEPDLDQLVIRNIANGRLNFTVDLAAALASETLAVFFAIGTPTGSDGANADVEPLMAAVQHAAMVRARYGANGFLALIVKSTVPVGTCAVLDREVASILPRSSFAIVSNPEFLREGCAREDFLTPDRIVVGSGSPAGLALMRRIYAPLTEQGYPLLAFEEVETAELIKYASNIFLATKIGLINEFSRLCEKVGADVKALAIGIGLDRRIGHAGLKTGPGFGGSCFPKDLRALVRSADDVGSDMPIARAVILSNERHKQAMVARIVERLDGNLRDRRIAVLGLSFKAGTDDVREAPAISVINGLREAGARIVAHDPVSMRNFASLDPGLEMAESAEAVFSDADAVVLVTEWAEFSALPWPQLQARMARPLIIDLRNHLDSALLTRLGYEYVGLGCRPTRDFSHLQVETVDAPLNSHPIAAE